MSNDCLVLPSRIAKNPAIQIFSKMLPLAIEAALNPAASLSMSLRGFINKPPAGTEPILRTVPLVRQLF